jgi:hypothetical protein
MRTKSALLLVSMSLLLAACAETITNAPPARQSYTDEFTYIASNKDVRVVVYGTAGGASKADTEDAVIQALQRAYVQYHANFTTTPGPSAQAPYKVVFVFGQDLRGRADAFCAATPGNAPATVPAGAAPLSGTSSSMMVLALFCDTATIAQAIAVMPVPPSAADSGFRGSLYRLAFELIPEEKRSPHQTY